ncbi:MAG: alternative ribosome rescue aminoacyl-tRNA hydrolase ArfB [Polyangiaceae bacterium]|nr:alternative ribosome rescue aminoacyl-tRNA hydrolase ArfB [Polyangiaceae bacterium]
MQDLVVNHKLTIPAAELSWSAVRAGGPGGQNVNKVATKVELRFDLRGSRVLSEEVKQRLKALASGRLDAEGRLRIVCQSARSQPRNLELALGLLAELVRSSLVVPRRRRPTKPSRRSNEVRLAQKKRIGDKKSGRRVPPDSG